jgi:hypothetical protein
MRHRSKNDEEGQKQSLPKLFNDLIREGQQRRGHGEVDGFGRLPSAERLPLPSELVTASGSDKKL